MKLTITDSEGTIYDNLAGFQVYFSGNLASIIDGKIHNIHGGEFVEIKMLEGAYKGSIRYITTKNVERQLNS